MSKVSGFSLQFNEILATNWQLVAGRFGGSDHKTFIMSMLD
jgi:hypothetical protein